MLADILGENQRMLADIGQEMGEGMNEIMSSNDQFLRDIFGEDLDTMFRRPERLRGPVTARQVRRELPARLTRSIEEGPIEGELLDEEPRMNASPSGLNTPEVLEAEIVAESVDHGAQIIRETGSAVRSVAHLPRPLPDFSALAAQAVTDMRTRRQANIADRRAKLDQAVAGRRARRR